MKNAAQEVANLLINLGKFSDGSLRSCPLCNGAVERIDMHEKIEPDQYALYVQPCGHRLGLWRNAPDWAHEIGIVHVIPLDLFDNEEGE